MSIRLMTQVWDNSKQDGTNLLLLLAIADFANDDGTAWPSIDTLANKTRMSRRNVQYLLSQLEDAGELTVEVNAGPHGCNLYRVQTVAPVQNSDAKLHPSKAKGVQSSSTGGAKQRRQIAHEPSGTVIDPSEENCQEPKPRAKKSKPGDSSGDFLTDVYERTKKGNERSYTVPPEAGGATPTEDALGKVYAEYRGDTRAGEKRVTEWGKGIWRTAQQWEATPEQAYRALRLLLAPDSEFKWRTYTSPRQQSFMDDYGLMLGRVMSHRENVVSVNPGGQI